jgi:GDPmannose 4,6-dehydratase
MKRALVTGRHGQDATYLIELLLEKGYRVTATSRPSISPEVASTLPTDSFDSHPDFQGCSLDLTSDADCLDILTSVVPDEVYHLAGPSHVVGCDEQPMTAADAIALGTGRMLRATHQVAPNSRFFFASSSEIFRGAAEVPQTERTSPHAGNTYGAAKLIAQSIVRSYRKLGMFACSGILYNHESPLRPERFVTRKVTAAAARISKGQQTRLKLGRIDARRDWSFAGDIVRAMWLMLQADAPDDYVVASGTSHRVADWLEIAFARVGLDWRDHVDCDQSLLREERGSQLLVGDSTKIRQKLGWRATVEFAELVRLMIDHDLALLALK